MNLYETLGVDEKANEATIKAAYREKAKTAHPDAGGDEKEFGELSCAYEVLSDPIKRIQYDATGDTSTTDKNRSFQMAIDIFFNAADGDPAQLGKRIAAIVKERRKAVEKTIRETQNDMRLCNELLERIKDRPGTDFLGHALNGKIKTTQQGLDYGKAMLEDIEKAGEMLAEYVFAERVENPGTLVEMVAQMRETGQMGATFKWTAAGSTS